MARRGRAGGRNGVILDEEPTLRARHGPQYEASLREVGR